MEAFFYLKKICKILNKGSLVGAFFFWGIIISCVPVGQESGGNRQSTSNDTFSSSGTPASTAPVLTNFTQNLNFLQNGIVQSTSVLLIENTFNHNIYLRGQEVDDVLRNNSTINTVQCLVVPFTTSPDKSHLILAAIPNFFHNFSTGAKEFFFLLQSTDDAINKAHCQVAAVTNAIIATFPAATFAYSIKDACPSCTAPLTSGAIEMYTKAGSKITTISTNHLTIRLGLETQTTNNNNPSCSGTSECTAQGFDCCSDGQCVKDGALKSNVNTSDPDYLQALADIQTNPQNFSLYPNFFHVCSSVITSQTTTTTTVNEEQLADIRVEKLRDLRDCITPDESGVSICTVSFENASTLIGLGTTFNTLADDLNFSTTYSGTTGISSTSIFEVTYAGQTLFKEGSVTLDPTTTFGAGNDTLTATQSVNTTKTKPESAPNDTLKIRYKIDGTCKQVSSTLAQCKKTYIQGQDTGKVSDHLTANQNFKIPSYTDTTKTITVEVDKSFVFQGIDWNLSTAGSVPEVQFIVATTTVFQFQTVEITFYVDLQTNPNAYLSRKNAQDSINSMCECGSDDCSLKAVTEDQNGVTVTTNFECVYPSNNTTSLPLQVTVTLSTKNTPVRFFDTNGVNFDEKDITGATQEGTKFEYTSGNVLTPNNVTTDIGFNEIYGSLSLETNAPQGPKVVRVTNGTTYDIFVDSGVFSQCLTCGTDYYSFVNQIFPGNFLLKGAGYFTDKTRTSRTAPTASQTTQYRSDDLLFGRACFIPATMIPWTHKGNTVLQTQRLNRLKAQHFLFANGYQRDWYGFDYGSVIGSFDGVRWFSIGNERRIKATSNKLYLAINAYFADLSVENNFSVTIGEASALGLTIDLPDTDLETDGALCQKIHECSTDTDCVTQLGWNYSCQSITGIKTTWPEFNAEAIEKIHSPGSEKVLRLIDIIGGSGGSTKRCVYRGQGAPCHTDYNAITSSTSYSQTDQRGLHMCSANTYCEEFMMGLNPSLTFNQRIARYAASPSEQNSSGDVPANLSGDTFGLAARILGRPFNLVGTEGIKTDVDTQLQTNKVISLCIAGTDPSATTYLGRNSAVPPSTNFSADKVLNIGMTPATLTSTSATYYAMCSVVDSNKNFLALDDPLTTLATNNTAIRSSVEQAMSTNAIKAFEVNGLDLVANFEDSIITSIIYQEDRCLRAPGSACFSNQDCAASEQIASFIATLNSSDVTVSEAELKFWQEELTCGQSARKTDSDYNLKNNRCCRDLEKTLTIFSDENSGTVINTGSAPGVDISLNTTTRYSRIVPAYNEMKATPTTHPSLVVAPLNAVLDISATPTGHPFQQHNTFHEIATRTCCTENWVRNFSDTNGGGHTWAVGKHQLIDKSNFICIDWAPCPTCNASTAFQCSAPGAADCLIKNLTLPESDKYLNFLGSLELTGIPQVLIQSDKGYTTDESITCVVDPTTQNASTAPIGGTILSVAGAAATAEATENGNVGGTPRNLLRADDTANFSSTVKQVFSPNTVTCCLPTGTTVASTVTDSMCCTGKKLNDKCCLPDFTNLTVYFNRYVSSEAKDLSTGHFDSRTGYLTSPDMVEQLAAQKNACCSGFTARGEAIGDLKIPGHEEKADRVRRFIYNNNDSDNFNGAANAYDAGVRWNNHVYCVPSGFN